jgi:hypothetical protein
MMHLMITSHLWWLFKFETDQSRHSKVNIGVLKINYKKN